MTKPVTVPAREAEIGDFPELEHCRVGQASWDSTGESIDHRFRASTSHLGDRRAADAGDVRTDHDVREIHQWRVVRRLDLEHVERRAGDRAVAEGTKQRAFINDRAARRVDQYGVWAHQSKGVFVDEVACRRDQRAMERNDVAGASSSAARQPAATPSRPAPGRPRVARRRNRRGGGPPCGRCCRSRPGQPCYRSGGPGACTPVRFHVPLRTAASLTQMGAGRPTSYAGMIGDGVFVGARRADDSDTKIGCSKYVDRVGPHAHTSDHLKAGAELENLGGERVGAGDHRVCCVR